MKLLLGIGPGACDDLTLARPGGYADTMLVKFLRLFTTMPVTATPSVSSLTHTALTQRLGDSQLIDPMRFTATPFEAESHGTLRGAEPIRVPVAKLGWGEGLATGAASIERANSSFEGAIVPTPTPRVDAFNSVLAARTTLSPTTIAGFTRDLRNAEQRGAKASPRATRLFKVIESDAPLGAKLLTLIDSQQSSLQPDIARAVANAMTEQMRTALSTELGGRVAKTQAGTYLKDLWGPAEYQGIGAQALDAHLAEVGTPRARWFGDRDALEVLTERATGLLPKPQGFGFFELTLVPEQLSRLGPATIFLLRPADLANLGRDVRLTSILGEKTTVEALRADETALKDLSRGFLPWGPTLAEVTPRW